MKIGLVSPYALTYGGVQDHVLNLSRKLREFGHEVKIIAPGSKKPLVTEDVIFVGEAKLVSFWRTMAPVAIGFYPELKKIFAREKFDIIHVHDPSIPMLSIQSVFFAPRHTPIVLTFHTVRIPRFYYHFWHPYIWFCAKKVSGGIVVSEATKKFHEIYFPKIVRDRAVLIPNAVDTEKFNPSVEPFEEYIDGKINILYVGRFEPRKEPGVLFDAYLKLRKKHKNLRLIMVGAGPLRRGLKRRANGKKDIVFVGAVSGADLPRYYKTADIYCSPASRGESFGIVLLEAMATGTPVVGADNEGYSKVIKDGQNGVLVPMQDVGATADALEKLILHPRARRRLAKNGLTFSKNYSWDKVARRIEKFYQEHATS